MGKKYCIFCSAEISAQAIFCIKCGKRQKVRGNNDIKIKPLIIEFINKIPDINQGTFYQREYIPKKKLENALLNVAPGIKASEIVFYVDMTVWGSGKEGLVFTKDKLFWNITFVGKNRGMIKYSKIKNISAKDPILLSVSP